MRTGFSAVEVPAGVRASWAVFDLAAGRAVAERRPAEVFRSASVVKVLMALDFLRGRVLEARDRVGGRTEGGHTADGTPVELGGQWVGPTQNRMYELIDELDLDTFPTWNEGELVVQLGGKASRMGSQRGAVPKLNPFALADLGQGLARFTRLASSVPLERPWEHPKARWLDGQTFETWIRRTLKTPTGRAYFRIACEAVFSAESTDLSALHALVPGTVRRHSRVLRGHRPPPVWSLATALPITLGVTGVRTPRTTSGQPYGSVP